MERRSRKTQTRQKDLDARWTKKNNEKHDGYKNYINADQTYKLVCNGLIILEGFIAYNPPKSGQLDE
ncbi:MAG: hypothetical protein V3U87_07640 [Methylococcaceae bacterium]